MHFVFEIGASLPPRYPLKEKWYESSNQEDTFLKK
jgi:hypothetical protein